MPASAGGRRPASAGDGLRTLFAVFNDRDWAAFDAAVAATFAEGFVLHRPKRGAPPLDRDAYAAAAKAEAETDPDLRYAPERVVEDGRTLAMTLDRHLRLDGRAVTVPLCLVASLDDRGRVTEIVEYAAAPRRAENG